MATATEARPVNYRALMKKVEHLVATLDRAEDEGSTIQSLIESIIVNFRDELGIYGGRLYRRRGAFYVLQGIFGDAKEVPRGLKVPVTYPPIELLIEDGAVSMDADDPRMDKKLEDLLGVERFAAIEVGDEEYILAFNVAPGNNREDILFSLGIVRHSVNQKLRRERMEGIFEEARKIQSSILPRRAPAYGDFDLYGHSVPVETVGGDFFDYIPVTDKILGLAIADVSGHGLPAALQVRDIYMGLRMGLARDFKIVRTVERMNRIIHRSTLTSRFVSLFYGELELNGVFIYVNAGHPPPFHLAADGTVTQLEAGGPVLGPLAEASYERGFVIMKAGDMLVFYTDGIVETLGRAPAARESRQTPRTPPAPLEEYGLERLLAVARKHQGKPSQAVVEAVFGDVEEWSEGAPAADDRTLMVVSSPADDKAITAAFPRPIGLI
ncbi:MAG TPA: PP2C family protein-serine/threonine phosphatase [Thermoanaerobaculia bacterium]|nr:PP2C family protein-serine/threonine phosphatase [Thermoanaerobaculia bacterium]